MKHGDFYQHFKGTEYFFCGIALPISEFTGKKTLLEETQMALDAHTPHGEEVQEVKLFDCNGIMLIDRDTPHVIYQSEKDYDTDRVWAREVNDFFGFKSFVDGSFIKRFSKK